MVTTNGYDAGNRLVSTSAASGVMIAYTYTSNNKIASIADALGNKTSFTLRRRWTILFDHFAVRSQVPGDLR